MMMLNSTESDLGLQQQHKKSPEELKERVKQMRSLEMMSKEETLKMRLQHVGLVLLHLEKQNSTENN